MWKRLVQFERGRDDMTGSSSYYVKFKDGAGNIRKEYIKAKNCSQAVQTAKTKYGAVSIYKTGRATNEKIGIFGRLF